MEGNSANVSEKKEGKRRKKRTLNKKGIFAVAVGIGILIFALIALFVAVFVKTQWEVCSDSRIWRGI